METIQFKTNIHCEGCIAAIKPHLDRLTNISHWQVDTANPSKILTIQSEQSPVGEIITVLKRAGYQAEQI